MSDRCHEIEVLLDGLVDDELDRDETRRVEEHLEGCTACRGVLDELRELGRRTRELPRGLRPERDLLPDIRRAAGALAPPRAGRRAQWVALAASLVLAAVLGAAGWSVLGPGRRGAGGAAQGSVAADAAQPASAVRSAFESAGEQYREASARLLEAIEADRDELSPEATRIIEENLRIIDAAILDVQHALEQNPTDARSGHTLTALYRHKLEFLWSVSRLSAGRRGEGDDA